MKKVILVDKEISKIFTPPQPPRVGMREQRTRSNTNIKKSISLLRSDLFDFLERPWDNNNPSSIPPVLKHTHTHTHTITAPVFLEKCVSQKLHEDSGRNRHSCRILLISDFSEECDDELAFVYLIQGCKKYTNISFVVDLLVTDTAARIQWFEYIYKEQFEQKKWSWIDPLCFDIRVCGLTIQCGIQCSRQNVLHGDIETRYGTISTSPKLSRRRFRYVRMFRITQRYLRTNPCILSFGTVQFRLQLHRLGLRNSPTILVVCLV